jgi:agmatine/peptidylarginine deiminase
LVYTTFLTPRKHKSPIIFWYNTIPKKGLKLLIRFPAQWEKQEYIMLVFPNANSDWKHSIIEIQESYIKLVKQVVKYQKCVILYTDEKDIAKIKNISKNIQFVQIKTNDTWIRDFGGICIYKNGALEILNFKFNAWGEKFDFDIDNGINDKLKDLGIFKNLINKDFILEGGSIDSNGKGTLLTTAKCIFNKNRNKKYSKEQIIQKLRSFFNTQRLIILKSGGLVGDDTDSHVDTLARFISDDTIAYVKCYDEKDTHYSELLKMENELKSTDFKLLPLPLPTPKYFQNHRLPATYLNFVFINNALIVPTYKDKYDKIALEKLQNFFPDRKIIGVDASIFIREHGSLHCATMNFYEDRYRNKSI